VGSPSILGRLVSDFTTWHSQSSSYHSWQDEHSRWMSSSQVGRCRETASQYACQPARRHHIEAMLCTSYRAVHDTATLKSIFHEMHSLPFFTRDMIIISYCPPKTVQSGHSSMNTSTASTYCCTHDRGRYSRTCRLHGDHAVGLQRNRDQICASAYQANDMA
jgi:hypothetical protein